jgi:hypothetical protein
MRSEGDIFNATIMATIETWRFTTKYSKVKEIKVLITAHCILPTVRDIYFQRKGREKGVGKEGEGRGRKWERKQEGKWEES